MNKTLKKIALIVLLVVLITSVQTVVKATSSEPKKYSSGENALELSGDFSANGCDGAIYVYNGAKLTITGNGSVKGEVCPDDGFAMAVYATGAGTEVTIEGGTYTNEADTFTDDQKHVDLIYVSDGAKVYIKGGSFKCQTPGWTLNSKNTSLGKIIVSGGEFYKFNPATANTEAGFGDGNGLTGGLSHTEVEVAEGCEVIQKGEWYVVCDHTNVNHNVQKDPTYIENGTMEHWLCNTCSTIFLNEAKTVKGTEADLVLPKLVQVSSGNANLKTEAVDSAISDSDITSSSTVTIPLGSLGTNVSSATLPVESLKDVANTDKELTIVTTEAKTTIDAKALDSIIEQAGNVTDIKIEVTKIAGITLNEKQKDTLKDKTISLVFSAKVLAGGNTISNFGGGKVKIEIPYEIVENAKIEEFVVVYIDVNGNITEIPTKYLDNNLVVELEHFSEYAVVKKSDLEAGESSKGESSNSGSTPATPAPAEPAKDVTPKTGILDMSLIIVSVIGIVALAGVVVIKKYNK